VPCRGLRPLLRRARGAVAEGNFGGRQDAAAGARARAAAGAEAELRRAAGFGAAASAPGASAQGEDGGRGVQLPANWAGRGGNEGGLRGAAAVAGQLDLLVWMGSSGLAY